MTRETCKRGAATHLAILALAVILAGALASCAKAPVVGELDPSSRRQRFEIALAKRAQAVGFEADLLAWPHVEGWRELPGLQARVLVGAPDAVRMRIGSWFGTAVDLSARGDSVTALLPGRRVAFVTAHARESLGVAIPGDLGYRVLSGVWTPPANAWADSASLDSLLVISWRDSGEDLDADLRMAVGTSGLPAWVELSTADDTLQVNYAAWRAWAGVWCPARLEVRERSGTFDVRFRLDGIRFRDGIGRTQFTVPIPEGTERFDAEDLREAFAEGGGS